jgi:hypothetical protein
MKRRKARVFRLEDDYAVSRRHTSRASEPFVAVRQPCVRHEPFDW